MKEILLLLLLLLPFGILRAQVMCDTLIVKNDRNKHSIIRAKFVDGDTSLSKILVEEISTCLNEIPSNDSIERFITLSFEIKKNGNVNKRNFSIESSTIFNACLIAKKDKLLDKILYWYPAKKGSKSVNSVVSIFIWSKSKSLSLSIEDTLYHKEFFKYNYRW